MSAPINHHFQQRIQGDEVKRKIITDLLLFTNTSISVSRFSLKRQIGSHESGKRFSKSKFTCSNTANICVFSKDAKNECAALSGGDAF